MKKKSSFIPAKIFPIRCPDTDLWIQVTKTIRPFGISGNRTNREFLKKEPLLKEEKKNRPFVSSQQCFLNTTPLALIKLDLHGLTHDQAYHRLKIFIRQAFAREVKKVSIITGKGISRQLQFMVQNGEKADLLQTQVPRWLEYFPQVKNWETAPRQKGGEGVLYVNLNIKK